MNRFCLVFVLLAASLLQAPGVPAQEAQIPAPAPAAAAAPAEKKADDPVVARVNSEAITEKQIESAIDQLASSQQLQNEQLQQRYTMFFSDALTNLIGLALLKQEGQQSGVTIDKAQADESYNALIKQFPSQEEFQKAMAGQGLSEAKVRSSIEDNLLLQQVINSLVKDAPASTPEAIKTFYDGNPQLFEQPEQVHAAHILLLVRPDATPEQKAEMKKKIEGIQTDIEAKTITFSEAAAKYSEDKSNAQKGGDLGFFGRDQMVKPFGDAAFSAQPGTFTLAETQFGYHLISVIEKKPSGKRSLEDSTAAIKSFLDQRARQETILKHVSDLRAKAKIENLISEQEWKKLHSSN